MKKQIVATINKIALLSTLVVGLVAVHLIAITSTVIAEPAACYVGEGSSFRQTTCEITNSRHAYFDSSGNRLTTLPDNTCYQQDVTVTGGVRYNQNDCATMEAFANAIASSAPELCSASGGEWVYVGGGTQLGCECKSPLTYSATSKQCVTPGSGGNSPDANEIPKARGPEECEKADNQCCESAGGDLNAENCGIVGLLNTVFNFISGGVALAVIGNIIYAGIQYSMAQGDPSAVGKAKNRIRGALVAFLLYLVLYAFLQWLIPGGVFFA